MADNGNKADLDGRTRVVFPDVLPLLPVRDLVVVPYMMAPLVVSRDLSLGAVEAAVNDSRDKLVLLAAQRDNAAEDPTPDEIHQIGCVGMIVKLRRLSDGRVKVLVQGLQRVKLGEFMEGEPYLRARYTRLPDMPVAADLALEIEATVRAAKDSLERWAQSGKVIAPELSFAISAAEDPGRLSDLIAACLALPVEEAQPLLESLAPLERLNTVNARLLRELDLIAMRARIETKAREELSKGQREVFLREQMRAIRTELGDADAHGTEIEELRARLELRGLPDEVASEAKKQLRRLEQLAGEAVEAGMLRAWLDWIVELPWRECSTDDLDLAHARAVLDEDHYDLRQVKDRILEYLAVHKLKGDRARGSILCLAGPPGVGKTSLGRSIARALGRRFARVPLGGVRDEGEIRGHRRTYVGAMPGRVLAGMKQAGTVNPVFMLDEIDKLGHEKSAGDPSAALLEVLDPEQNGAFRDHYLGLPYDLSRVLFLATCNHALAVPPALRDRLEVIELSGYSERQKLAIARRHLVPRQLEAAGLGEHDLEFTGAALRTMIGQYTRESGLRDLERQIARVSRKRARQVAERGARGPSVVTAKSLQRRLGVPPYPPHAPGAPGAEDIIGVAVGLAWTPYGGEVLQVEAQSMPGKGTLMLTGQLGDVMRESAQAALSWARARAASLGLAEDFFGQREIHVHVPAGAVPKDGPSAGATMAVALVSLLAGVPVMRGVAMTGEITLRGHVLPIGGLKEKLLAAARTPAITTVLVPEGNERELAGLPRHLRERLRIVAVRTIDDVLAVAVPGALARPQAERALRVKG